MSLFNPTLLLFLALLLLVSGLLLFYMDLKMREQNHKIKAIADLATTIAQSIKGGNVSSNDNSNSNSNNDKESNRKETTRKELSRENIQLIQVSDDEDDDDEGSESDDSSDDEDDDEDDNEDDDEDNDEDDDEDENGDGDEEPVKLNINIHDTDSDIKHVFLSQEQLNEAKEEPGEASVVEVEELQVNPPSEAETGTGMDTFKIVLSSELDYKKMTIPKLRQLVSEKGLAPSSETSKMKKPELLKLLEAE